MSVDLKEFGQRLDSLLKNPKEERGKKPTRIKQKDLAKGIGVSENTIKYWKDGNEDIKLSNIYLIVKYVQDHFKTSKPMQILFPDLLADEIQRLKQDSFDKGKQASNTELNKEKKNHKNELEKLQKQITALEDEIEVIKRACRYLDLTKQTDFLFMINKEHHELAVKLGLTS